MSSVGETSEGVYIMAMMKASYVHNHRHVSNDEANSAFRQ